MRLMYGWGGAALDETRVTPFLWIKWWCNRLSPADWMLISFTAFLRTQSWACFMFLGYGVVSVGYLSHTQITGSLECESVVQGTILGTRI